VRKIHNRFADGSGKLRAYVHKVLIERTSGISRDASFKRWAIHTQKAADAEAAMSCTATDEKETKGVRK
jgi:hypothetical protein